MGVGDALMASGEARKLYKSNKLPTVIVDRYGRPYWNEMWDGVSYILKRAAGKQANRLQNGPGVRPYIAGKTPNNWTWKKYTPVPAEIHFTPEEIAFAEPYRGLIMIEPNVKNIGHTNKRWQADRWLELSRSRNDFVQCVQSPEQALPSHVLKVLTPSFRHAAAVQSVCRAFIGTEGGLHHSAAANDTPAVVIFGGFISPLVTGYPKHRNLFTGTGLGCGIRTDCAHCRKAMEAITVDMVLGNLAELLESHRNV